MRAVSSDGENLGVIPVEKALEIARNEDLDLVEVAPAARPPVCKIMDYNKYYYEQKKKRRENKKKAVSKDLKQIRLSPNIGKHDLQTKFGKIKRFLEKGHKVKVNMMFRGRQREHQEMGKEIMTGIIHQLEDTAECTSEPCFEGFYMSMMLSPLGGNNNKKDE